MVSHLIGALSRTVAKLGIKKKLRRRLSQFGHTSPGSHEMEEVDIDPHSAPVFHSPGEQQRLSQGADCRTGKEFQNGADTAHVREIAEGRELVGAARRIAIIAQHICKAGTERGGAIQSGSEILDRDMARESEGIYEIERDTRLIDLAAEGSHRGGIAHEIEVRHGRQYIHGLKETADTPVAGLRSGPCERKRRGVHQRQMIEGMAWCGAGQSTWSAADHVRDPSQTR